MMIDGFTGALASFMDLTQRPESERLARFITKTFREEGGLDRVVDIGCGTGLLVSLLVDSNRTCVGIDSSAEMVSLARDRLGGRASFVLADAVCDQLPNVGADLCLVINGVANSICYSRDIRTLLENLRSVLRAGGRLWVETFTLEYLQGLGQQSVVEEGSDATMFVRSIWLSDSEDLLMRLSGTVHTGRGIERFDNLIRYRHVSPESFERDAVNAGYSAVRTIEDLSDSERICFECIL